MTKFSRFLGRLQRITLIIGVIVTMLMMALTVIDVILRTTLHKSFYGTIEVTQFMLAIIIFAGLALITRDRSHIVVSLFEPLMLRHVPRFYELLFSAFNLLGPVAITYLMIKSGLELLRLGQRSLVLDLPQGWLLLAMGGLGAVAVLFGVEVFRTRPNPDLLADHTQPRAEK
ncbi:MAG: TRAP transporter small permease [Qingshengfaniella sp.]